MVQLLSKSTRCNNYLSLSSNTTYRVTYKGGNNNFQEHTSLTAYVTISPYNMSIPFEISFFLFNDLVGKTYTYRRGYRGPPQLLTWVFYLL